MIDPLLSAQIKRSGPRGVVRRPAPGRGKIIRVIKEVAWSWEFLVGVALALAGLILWATFGGFPIALIYGPILAAVSGSAIYLMWGASALRCFVLSFGMSVVLSSIAYGFTPVEDDMEKLFQLAAFDDYSESLQSLIETGINAPFPVYIWRKIYWVFSICNVEPNPGMAVLLNSALVATCGGMTVRISQVIYGADHRREALICRWFSFCGICLQLGSMHLRDAFAMFFVAVVLLAWIKAMQWPAPRRFVGAAVVTAVLSYPTYLTRNESLAVPAMLVFASLLGRLRARVGIWPTAVVGGVMFVGLILLTRDYSSQFLAFSSRVRENYAVGAFEGSSENSLGYRLVVSQAPPLRLLFGTGYLLAYPIPIWGGLGEKFYFILMTWHGVFMLLFTPYLLVGSYVILRGTFTQERHMITLGQILYVFWALLSAIVMTSFEWRHVAQMIPMMIMIACVTVGEVGVASAWLRRARVLWLTGILVIHVFWVILKVL